MAEPSTSQNQNHTATATTTTTTTTSWGTLEELLLACAINRYGTNSWDSIAKELQNRTTLSHFTPHICQQKYRDLKRRFASETRIAAENDAILWLDELRRLRVDELRRELQRYDLSIVSLQLKVKKLKEESDSDKNKNKNNNVRINNVLKEEVEEEEIKDDEKLDLHKNQKKEGKEEEVEERKEEKEVKEVKKNEAEGETWNSAESTRSNLKEQRVNSGEMVESVAESKEGVKESSDVQSTANGSNGNKMKKVGVLSGTSSGGGEENQNQTQALVEFLEVVRGRKLGSFFERRLLTQETPKYKNLIKQHIDLETIQKRLDEGQYADCQTKFYRDVRLLINNAIIFYSKKSPERKAALEIRQLLTKQFQTHVSSPDDHRSGPSNKSAQPAPLPKPTKPDPDRPDLKQPKLTITGPVIVCRKRSSIAGKSSRGGGGERKETALATPPGEKLSSLGEKTFNAVTKKRTRDQSFLSKSSSSKGNRKQSPSTPMSGKGESSEAKADKKRPSPGSSLSEMRQALGSGSGKHKGTLLLESLKNSDKRKTGNGGNGGSSVKGDRRKSECPQKGSGSKVVKEKAKGVEEGENNGGSRSNKRPPKRAAAIAAMGKRGGDGGGETESQSKKRQRK